MKCERCGRDFAGRGRQRLCPECKLYPSRLPERPCIVCGKLFTPVQKNDACCGPECRKKRTAQRQRALYAKLVIHNACDFCGKQFDAACVRRYCSKACQEKARRERCAPGGADREISGLTVYLAHKYSMEGMSVAQIADILKRSEASVRKALASPLTPAQRYALNEFLIQPRRGRKGS